MGSSEPSDGGWGELTLPPLPAMASLEPTKHGGTLVASDTAFRLKSLDGTPVAQLAERVVIEPTVELIAGAPSGDAITLRPASRLHGGQAYRISLARADGSIAHRWTVTTATALRLVGTIPGDQSVGVPIDTAIEMTFDQSGVTATAVEEHFTISPATAGRFERHGRSVAFIPDEPLEPFTIYSVTLAKGLPLAGTGQSMPAAATFRFETQSTTAYPDDFSIHDVLVDVAVADKPVVAGDFYDRNEDGRVKVPSTLPVTVHRLDTADAAMAAWRRLAVDMDWAMSAGAPVSTRGLERVLAVDVPVERVGGTEDEESSAAILRLPTALPRGWFVLTATFEGRPQQVLIQVANIAAFAQVTETRTAVWVNSVGTGEPIGGASVSVGGTAIGRTDEDGLRVATTPPAARSTGAVDAQFVIVRAEGRTLIVPLGSGELCGKCWTGSDDVSGHTDPGEAVASTDDFWYVMALDRQRLRPTDRLDVWGVVKTRADGTVPDEVELSLEAQDEWSAATPPIVVRRARPLATGMFSVQLPFSDAPVGDYDVVLHADGKFIDSQYVRIEPIVKPAFTLGVTTSKRAVLSGTTVDVSVAAAFFEGTPVAGVDLRVGGPQWVDEEEAEARDVGIAARTGLDGHATVALPLRLGADEGDDGESSQWEWVYVGARPSLPEEAEIQGQTWAAVFRSTALLDVAADLDGERLVMTGSVHDVDFAGMERATSGYWEIDARGDPRADAIVRLKVVEVRSIRTKVGTTYDAITKTVRPAYEYSTRETDLGTRSARTRTDGTFRLGIDVTAGRGYRVLARYVDEGERAIRAASFVGEVEESEQTEDVRLTSPGDDEVSGAFAVGQTVTVEMTGGHPKASDDRYLFLVSSMGLRQTRIQAGPTFTTAFRSSWVPSASIRGVRFTGSGYEVTDYPYTASLDTDSRELTVRMTTDRARYEPGDAVRLSVRTTDGSGDPVAASVALRAIDEKLYAIGAAGDVNLLGALYSGVGDGVVAIGWSHGNAPQEDGFGDTTGGGGDERSDFRDSVLFRVVSTDADGRASVSFDLSDDLTSWRVSAAALDADLEAGSGSLLVPVGLPFFAEATLAQEYLTGDRPDLRIRGYGSDLRVDADVTFTVSSTTLGLAATTVSAKAFTSATISLPVLTAGTHSVRIAASTGTGTSRRQDVLVRTFTVVPTRTVAMKTASAPLAARFDIDGGATGFTKLVLSDAGRGRVVPTLLSWLSASTARGDAAMAASVARSVLLDGFDMAPDEIGSPDPVDLTAFQPSGAMVLLPYGSPDLELSVLAAFVDDPTIDRTRLRDYLTETREEDDALTREREIVILAGRAAFGEPMLDAIREAAAAPDLTPVERAWLALGAFASGDEAMAADLERDLLADEGERLGSWVRVSLGNREDSAMVTALLAITAAGIGDPLAADMDAYLESVPPQDALVDLQRALAARHWVERTPASDAAATLTVDGASQRLEVGASTPVLLTLTPAQLRSATLEPVSGSIVVSSTWEGPFDPGSLEPHGISTFARTVTPAGTIGLDDIVTVEYHVAFGEDGDLGCWRVTDFVPAGLAPIAVGLDTWFDDEGNRIGVEGPLRIVGQRIDFCTSKPTNGSEATLRYLARVVTPGVYVWEPVAIQSTVVPTWGRTIGTTQVTVGAE